MSRNPFPIKIRQEYVTFTLRENQYIFLAIFSLVLLLRTRSVPDKTLRENQNTDLMFSNIFVFEIRAFMG
jgi:fumarate reductase subunit C